ncbi:DNA polymerase III subunit delta [Heyndrickxia acidicola]|uniref:DNA polymerase III subunit delta n=1 Tax=Heyndrickxia acidicola TaxID=209389 RepID=A0ABU6MKM2_9BACI|nr:DNA polymerase III subunit delta [Heyndrickxia acidicola]MED1205070.1 DNA polymerase III subunit delta [Heyndrickxia acidicola]
MNVLDKIKKKNFSAVYLLYGTERFLINEAKQILIQNALTEEEMDFNFSSYDLEEMPVELTLEDAETFPFVGERKLVFLHNPTFLTAEKTKGKIEHNIAKLEAYLEEPAPYSILVISAPYEKLDERKKITKLLKKKAEVLEAKKLTEAELGSWIQGRAELNGVRITKDAADMLSGLAGTDLMMLTNEIDKISLYVGKGNEINQEMVEKLTARSLEQNIFSLVDKVVHRKIDEALRIFYDLLKQNEEPIKILSILAGQFRLIYQTKELARRGYGQQQIASTLKVHPFRVKLAAGQAKLFSEHELKKIMDMLAESDLQMKSSGLDKKMVVEMFFFQLNSQKT